ncbi:MAG: hypothetical protein SNJ78_02960 [Spirochaetales bacterium]
MIGLKLADGRFFPLMEESETRVIRVILTPVTTNQSQVKVDLLRGDPEEQASSWEYLASLVLEHIKPLEDGNAELELLVQLFNANTLVSRIKDLGSGEYQSLRIDLESLDTGELSLPDYQPEMEFLSLSPSYSYEGSPDIESRPLESTRLTQHPYFYPALFLFLFLCLVILGIVIYLIFYTTKGTPPPALSKLHSYGSLYLLLMQSPICKS